MVCRTVSDGNFLRRIKRERGTHPYDTVKEKWYGGSDANVTGTGTTAAGIKAPGRAQNLTCQVAFLMAVAVKSAFALLLTKVTKLMCLFGIIMIDKRGGVFIGEND